jgi:hypothetical protein
MKNHRLPLLVLSSLGLGSLNPGFATNPLIMDQFTADPTARVFEGRIYVYPSHDILAGPGKGRTNWFCMEDYHVFSSANLTDWTDHGVILSQTNVDWVNPTSCSLWAPDCVFKNGKYYFYFPAAAKGRGMRIGVAVADKPFGPFKPEPQPIEGVRGIDPCVFIDKDGSPYLFYSLNKIFVARLKDNMLEMDSEPRVIGNLPQKGLLEGPFVFERKGIYYLTYPHVQNATERLEYSTGASPLGPFNPAGVILDELPSGCWTVHQSIVEYQGQWYLFYHDKDLSPDFDKNRSIRADRLSFKADGTIEKVIPTLRGVGLVDAKSKMQIDRYSAISNEGVSVSFLNETNKHEGWKVSLKGTNGWVRFNDVDFGKKDLKSVNVRSISATGGLVEIRLDKVDGPLLAEVQIARVSQWKVIQSKLVHVPSGIHNLVVTQNGISEVGLDWMSFE